MEEFSVVTVGPPFSGKSSLARILAGVELCVRPTNLFAPPLQHALFFPSKFPPRRQKNWSETFGPKISLSEAQIKYASLFLFAIARLIVNGKMLTQLR
jgi:hypothetical protein